MLHKHANPQGKGLVPVMDSLAASRASLPVPPKPLEQMASELFTSLFVLNSRFQFKPVVGKPYWLYRRNNAFHLSMIAPQEWGGRGYGQYIGECVLQQDVTWSLELDAGAARDAALMTFIEARRREFERALQEADAIDRVLPFYMESLPFYQRVFASALASSLQASMRKSGMLGLGYEEARGLPVANRE